MERSILDALTGLFYVDDSQVCDGRVRKVYSDTQGVEIEIVNLAVKYESIKVEV
jgi:Holliday junction resolvase RusA-like endonuclease